MYFSLFSKWQQPVFNNIGTSEKTHMDLVLTLLDKYSLIDPVGLDIPGNFQNQTLQKLYDSLVNKGYENLNSAMKVGGTIEDQDLFDLANSLKETDNQDIRLAFSNLRKGSRNHLRAFYRNITNLGNTYTAQYNSQSELDSIVHSPMEAGY